MRQIFRSFEANSELFNEEERKYGHIRLFHSRLVLSPTGCWAVVQEKVALRHTMMLLFSYSDRNESDFNDPNNLSGWPY